MNENNGKIKVLADYIKEEKKKFLIYWQKEDLDIPNYIIDNIKYNLRNYQKGAIENLLIMKNSKDAVNNSSLKWNNLSSVKEQINDYSNNHYLFHMATGSGKTLIIAATILHMYKLWYKKFIFFNNRKNIINKTKINLLPQLQNKKCEFNNKIIIDWKEVKIKEVDVFSTYSDDIEIIFTTIQGLHDKIQENKENNINLDILSKFKICMLADEAHHYQNKTKKKWLSKEEKELNENTKNWETTIQTILNLSNNKGQKENMLFEYTATMDLKGDILEKYKDKILFDYTIKDFRKDGYSKDVSLMQIPDIEQKIKIAIIISYFRWYLASKNKQTKHLIPRILFKCDWTILELNEIKKYVFKIIEKLDINELLKIIEIEIKKLDWINVLKHIKKEISIYDHDSPWFEHETELDEEKLVFFLNNIKKYYNQNTSISIHSKENEKEKEEKMNILNSIDSNQDIRMIFAIDILNEWWDVLSLFDIVKLDKEWKSNNSTITERQLIGRWMRLFPYEWNDSFWEELNRYKRKFDINQDNELRILEELFFYTANENKYIEKLTNGLIEDGILPEKELIKVEVQKLNENQNSLFQIAEKLKIFTNEKVPFYNNSNKKSKISEYNLKWNIEKSFIIDKTDLFDPDSSYSEWSETKGMDLFLNGEDWHYSNRFILEKVVKSFNCFNYNNLGNYIKIWKEYNLIEDIIETSKNFNLKVIWSENLIIWMPYKEKKEIIIHFLNILSALLEKEINKTIWTKEFNKEIDINDLFVSYYKNKNHVSDFNKEIEWTNSFWEKLYNKYRLVNKKYFYYNSISWDSLLEIQFLDQIDKNIITFYKGVDYLIIRNEVGYKFFNYENTDYSWVWFEPDFIIIKRERGSNLIKFLIAEVKWLDFKEDEWQKWKERLLKELKIDKEVDWFHYIVKWLPFFTEDDSKEYRNKKENMKYMNWWIVITDFLQKIVDA